MKVKELKEVLWSPIGEIQWTDVWNVKTCELEVEGCSIEFARLEFEDWELVRISTYKGHLVLSVKEGV